MQETGEALLMQAIERLKRGKRVTIQAENSLIPVVKIRPSGPLAVLTREDHTMQVIQTSSIVSISD